MAFSAACHFSALSLNGLRFKVRIGWSEEERQTSQFVRFDVRIRFETDPEGCRSDQLKDSICYGKLSDRIREICTHQDFHLIEKLAWTVFSSLKEKLPEKTMLWIRTTKEKPPIPELQEGASFILGDWVDF